MASTFAPPREAAAPTQSSARYAPQAGPQLTAPERGGVPRRRAGWFANLTVRVKILSLVGLFALASIGSGAMAVTAIGDLSTDTTTLATIQRDITRPLQTVHQGQLKARMIVAQVAAAPTAADKQAWLADQDSNDAEIAEAAAAFEAAVAAGGESSPSWTTFTEGWATWTTIRDTELIPAALGGDVAEYERILMNTSEPAKDAYLVGLDAMAEELTAYSDQMATQASSEASSAVMVMIVVLLATVIAVVALGLVVARSIRNALGKVKASLDAMATGDLTVRAGVSSTDEIGLMAASLETAQDELRQTLSQVAEATGTIAAASEEMSAAGSQVAAGSEETSVQAGVVAAAAEQVSRNVQAVAAGAEQMGASIREIAQNANEAAKVAGQAVQSAESTAVTVGELGESSKEIGNVVKAITSIAEQTNLLALNATIEAARAGEAGKGFAVVAGEVKELAQESARAAEDIAARIATNQTQTASAVAAIGEISAIIAQINDYQLTIASAVEEQTATTNEMSRGVTEAATGSGEIAVNITGVATAASTSTEVVTQMQASIRELAEMSAGLRARVAAFTF